MSPISRRRLTALIVGGALTGASWTAGLAVLARGRHPQLFVLGSDQGQVLLLEHGTNRIVILAGTFKQSPEPAIDLLCGLLRQHVDVVVCDRQTLDLLSSGFRARRAVTTIVDLNGGPLSVNSQRFISLSNAIRMYAGALDVDIAPLPAGQWQGEVSNGPGWIVHITIGSVVIAVGSTLDSIAEHGHIEATLAMAPSGDVVRLWRTIPGIVVATNARDALSSLVLDAPAIDTRLLVRTFGKDIAHFVIRNGRIELPDWTQDLRSGSGP